MTMDMKLVRGALKASGIRGCAKWFLLFPLGRERRVLALLGKRHSLLEAKNGILDTLSRVQRPLQTLGLDTVEQVTRAMADPGKRRLVLSLGLSREVLEDEATRWGTELGSNFGQALTELRAEGRALRVLGPAGDDVYLIASRLMRQRYDLSPLDRVLRRGKEYGRALRTREKDGTDTEAGRTYRM